MMIIGIDPGLNGAVAILSDNGNYIKDIPTIRKGKTGNKRELDPRNLYLMLEPLTLQHEDVIVYLEQVDAMPGQGVTSMFSMGHTLGGIKGVIASLGLELHLVTPQKWKKYFSLNKDKELSRATAIQFFPHFANDLKRKKDADRAEALLIAKYGYDHQNRKKCHKAKK